MLNKFRHKSKEKRNQGGYPTRLLEKVHTQKSSTIASIQGTPHGPCKGTQTTTPRVFVHHYSPIDKCPPVLILSVSYLSLSKQLVPGELPARIVIQGNRYCLSAYTLGSGGHFRAYININGKWNKYDGLQTPEISEVSGRGSDGQLEHVVYAIDEDTSGAI